MYEYIQKVQTKICMNTCKMYQLRYVWIHENVPTKICMNTYKMYKLRYEWIQTKCTN